MTKSKNSTKVILPLPNGVPAEFLDLLPGIKLFPGEDATTYEGLRQALLADLAPGSPYETTLAENLVTLEWEAIRHRQLRDGLLLAEYRDQAMGVFEEGKVGTVFSLGLIRADRNPAFDLVNPDPDIRQAAEDQLTKYQITPTEILAKAYASIAGSLEPHERKIADIEIRRRRLRADYDALKAVHARPVEDAEIVQES